MYKKDPIKCIVCGKFIPTNDLVDEIAQWKQIYPESDLSIETWEGLCRDHYEKDKK